MNTPLYIAQRMGQQRHKVTAFIKSIAVISISLGLTVMILAVAIVTGFQNEIREKVIGFGAHIQITPYDFNFSQGTSPIEKDQYFVDHINEIEGIKHIQVFSLIPGIIKTNEQIHGIIFKGIGNDFNWDFFQEHIIKGEIPQMNQGARSNEIVISEKMSRILELEPGDDLILYFIQDPPRLRRLTVAAIYQTGMEDLDNVFVLGDIAQIQHLNNWSENQVSGFEVLVEDFNQLHEINYLIRENLPYQLTSRTIHQLYPHIFDWLNLLDMNVYVIIFIMILVAGINMITTLLITVLEKTNLIGILKALGGSNGFVRKVFLYHSGFMIFKGLLWGNVLGLGIALLQHHFRIIKLDQASYFVETVPVNIELMPILLLNLGTFLICMLMLLLPSYIISKVSPVKAITFR